MKEPEMKLMEGGAAANQETESDVSDMAQIDKEQVVKMIETELHMPKGPDRDAQDLESAVTEFVYPDRVRPDPHRGRLPGLRSRHTGT